MRRRKDRRGARHADPFAELNVAYTPAPTDERMREHHRGAALARPHAQAHAERSRSRRAGDDAHRADRNDLRA